jgi:hypothetical protein
VAGQIREGGLWIQKLGSILSWIQPAEPFTELKEYSVGVKTAGEGNWLFNFLYFLI